MRALPVSQSAWGKARRRGSRDVWQEGDDGLDSALGLGKRDVIKLVKNADFLNKLPRWELITVAMLGTTIRSRIRHDLQTGRLSYHNVG